MSCESFDEAKVLLLYGESGPGLEELEDHLGLCSACREEVGEMDEVSVLYRESSRETLPLSLRNRNLTRPPARPWWFVYVAASILVALCVGFLLRDDGTSEVADTPFTDINFNRPGIVLDVSEQEVKEAEEYVRYAPPAWSLPAGSVERVDFEIGELENNVRGW